MEIFLKIFLYKIIKTGAADVETPRGAFRVGGGGEPACTIRFADYRAPLKLMRNPEFAFGELYMNGRIDVVRGTIYDALALVSNNLSRAKLPFWVNLLRHARDNLRRFRPHNDLLRARDNVERHDDLGEQLYCFEPRPVEFSSSAHDSRLKSNPSSIVGFTIEK